MSRERKSNDVVWHEQTVTRARRRTVNGHGSAVLWFTGLSGAGKSTVANAVEEHLHSSGCHTFLIDGDNVRHGLCGDLDFSAEHRAENIRRVGEVSRLFVDAGVLALTAFISPFRSDRDRVRQLMPAGDFIEIYCRCPLEVCEERDVKGLYRRARAGQIAHFTGISSPYEEPVQPELVLDTHVQSLGECVTHVMNLLQARDIVRLPRKLSTVAR